ncbi:unnamed protein product, partial [Prorocentrum cordatum]
MSALLRGIASRTWRKFAALLAGSEQEGITERTCSTHRSFEATWLFLIGSYWPQPAALSTPKTSEQLGVFLRRSKSPWVLAGGFNLAPDDVKLREWVELLTGAIAAPSGPTCFASKNGSTIDYLVVSQGLANFVSDVRAIYGTPSSPHVAASLQLKGPALNAPLRVRSMAGLGPLETGGVQLEDAWCQWLFNMEHELCSQFDLVGSGQRGYTGRADGFERKQVPLATSMEKAAMSGGGGQMRAWRSLDAILPRFRGLQDHALDDRGQAAEEQEVSLTPLGFVLPDYTSPSTGPPPLPRAAWPSLSGPTTPDAPRQESAASEAAHTASPQPRAAATRRRWRVADSRQALLDELGHLDFSELTSVKSIEFDLHVLRATAEAGGEDLETLASNVHKTALEASQAAAKEQLQEWREWAQSA